MNAHYNIREARSEDIPILVQLIEGVFFEYDWVFDANIELPDLMDFEHYYNTEEGLPKLLVTCLKDGDEPVACAAIKPDNRGAYLSRVYVSRSHRRQGIARAMISKLVEEALDQDIHYVHLWTDTQFEDAHKLYEHLEFVFTGHARSLNDPNNCFEYHYERLV
jgi:GNAT superfamily N-acetyltransferase